MAGATGEFHSGKSIVKVACSRPGDAFKLSGAGAKFSVLSVQERHARNVDPEKLQYEPQTDGFMDVAETFRHMVRNDVEDYWAGVPNNLAAIVDPY